jgi:hypothetical protein
VDPTAKISSCFAFDMGEEKEGKEKKRKPPKPVT